MQICYVDESGDTRNVTHAHAHCTPVCVVAGVVFDQAVLKNLTHEFLSLKKTTHPHMGPHGQHSRLRWVLSEIKGADLRRSLRAGAPRRNRRHTIYFLDKFVSLLEDYEAKIVGRVWVKAIGGKCDDVALYSSSIQAICSYFNHYLGTLDQMGYVIADSRTPTANVSVSHSIFTQKFKLPGDEYDRVLEMPTFGDSPWESKSQTSSVQPSSSRWLRMRTVSTMCSTSMWMRSSKSSRLGTEQSCRRCNTATTMALALVEVSLLMTRSGRGAAAFCSTPKAGAFWLASSADAPPTE